MPITRTSLLGLSLALLSAGCFKGPGFLKSSGEQSSSERTPPHEGATSVQQAAPDDSGTAHATLNADATTTQVVEVAPATGNGAITGVQLAFPPGSLAVDTQIGVSEGVPLANAPTAAALGIQNGFSNSGTAVLVSSSVPVDAIQPFTVAIPLPSDSSLNLDAGTDKTAHLVVLYKVTDAKSGDILAGVIPTSLILVKSGFAQISTTHFGIFQAAYAGAAVTAAFEVKAQGTPLSKAQSAQLPALILSARSPLVVKAGDKVTLSGANFRPTMTLALSGKPVSKLSVASDVSASFVVPDGLASSVLNLTAEQDGVTQSASLIYQPSTGAIPVITLPVAQVCSGVRYYDQDGTLQTGTMSCSAPAVVTCTSNGQVDCMTTQAFKAADLSNLAAGNIKAGVVLAGTTGSLPVAPGACATDGASNCVVDGSSYKAAAVAALAAANIKTGVTIGAVAGSLTPAPANCSADGTVGCVSTAAFKSADLSVALASNIKSGVTIAGVVGSYTAGTNCTADGQTGCVATSTYKSANTGAFTAGDIKNGKTIAGVAGGLNDCAADGTSGCVTTATYKSANTGAFTASDIKSGKTIGGVAGSLANCASDGSTGCVAISAFPAANMSLVTAGNIKAGSTIAGVTGAYPSSTYPLPGTGGGGISNDLTTPVFNAYIKSSGSFEWFDSAGARYTGTGSTSLTAVNIVNGVTIFGTTGTFGTNCSTDGQVACLTTSTFPALDKTALNAWDLRRGKTAGGVTGNMLHCKNGANTTLFNNSAAPATGSLDVYDTIDDFNNNQTGLPALNPFSGGDICAASNWHDVTTDGSCDSGGDQCVLQDLSTGLKWSAVRTAGTWSSAISACSTIGTFGGVTGWRLPTQKELLEAYISGIRAVESTYFGDVDVNFWSSTTQSDTVSFAYVVDLGAGSSAGLSKTSSNGVICVAP